MVFEDRTFENILQEMLDTVPDDVDKREGSIIYDALAPAAAKMAQEYIDLNSVLLLGFAETSNGEWLDKRVGEKDITRNPAVKAIREATFNIPVPEGARFFVDDLYFVVVENQRVECETAGEAGNNVITGSTLIPVDNINGLTTSTIGNIVVPGAAEETDEELFERYQESLQPPAENGNRAQYKKWATDVEGVGDAKVFPLWNGPNTVKVVIIDSTKGPASSGLVEMVQDYIDPGITGLGDGVAPIGAFCTVESAAGKAINISVTLVLKTGRTIENATAEITPALDAYYQELAFEDNVVRIAQIGNILLLADSVLDYSDLLMNEGTANIELQETEVPVRGTVILSE